MNITGVILAAGTSSRMGDVNKLLLPYKEHTVIEEVVHQMVCSKVKDILVITGHESEAIEERLQSYVSERIRLVHNNRYKLGRAESIKCGVRNMNECVDAALFMVADKPGVQSELIDRAIERFERVKPSLLLVETPNGRGHPVIFSRRMFNELVSLEGDIIGDELIARHKDDLDKLTDSRVQIDIDTEDDYQRLLHTVAT